MVGRGVRRDAPSPFPGGDKNMKKKTKSRIAIAMAANFLILAALLAAFLMYCRQAAQTAPSPDMTAEEAEAAEQGDGFPEVDWAYWQSINADIIGWITIPGTDVNSPILQAPADDPDYYLHHDVYKNYNPHGAIYLDAECREMGLSSRNAVILGHHFGNDTVSAPFGIIASYTDRQFAAEHYAVLIQTPNSKMTYEVRFAQIVNGLEPSKRTSFEGEADYRAWYDSSRDSAAMVLDAETEPNQTVSLVTCSYNIWVQNERTVLVTSMARETGQDSAENGETASDGL